MYKKVNSCNANVVEEVAKTLNKNVVGEVRADEVRAKSVDKVMVDLVDIGYPEIRVADLCKTEGEFPSLQGRPTNE